MIDILEEKLQTTPLTLPPNSYALRADVIVAQGTRATPTIEEATDTIPISCHRHHSDGIDDGLVRESRSAGRQCSRLRQEHRP